MITRQTRILLVDDQVLFRKGLLALFEARPEFEVVAEANNGMEAIDLAHKTNPDIILMDIDMPVMNGLVATRVIKKELPQITIVMLTVFDHDAKLFTAIKEGASGYLLKDMEPEELFAMLEKTQRGEAAINSVLAARILKEFSSKPKSENKSSVYNHLTEREMEVLEHLVSGKNTKEMAAVLSISTNTVKTHLENILEKLHLRNRIEAALYAVSEGLVEYHPKYQKKESDKA